MEKFVCLNALIIETTSQISKNLVFGGASIEKGFRVFNITLLSIEAKSEAVSKKV